VDRRDIGDYLRNELLVVQTFGGAARVLYSSAAAGSLIGTQLAQHCFDANE
jgi:hypothetical protein